MKHSKKCRFRPSLENLDRRDLPAVFTGVTATLADGVLSVSGSNPNGVIQINLQGRTVRGQVRGAVVVKGAGRFQAAQVDTIEIEKAAENAPVLIRRQGRWSPPTSISVATDDATPPPAATPPPVLNPPTWPPVVVIPTPPPPATPTPPPAAPGDPVPAGVILSPIEQGIVDQTNQIRVQNGLAPLNVNAQLISMARLQAGNMAQFNIMAHTIPQAAQPDMVSRAKFVGYRYGWLAENIAYNYQDADSVMNGWMGSTGHRANILNANVTEIGVGVVADKNGSLYFCQVFASPSQY